MNWGRGVGVGERGRGAGGGAGKGETNIQSITQEHYEDQNETLHRKAMRKIQDINEPCLPHHSFYMIS